MVWEAFKTFRAAALALIVLLAVAVLIAIERKDFARDLELIETQLVAAKFMRGGQVSKIALAAAGVEGEIRSRYFFNLNSVYVLLDAARIELHEDLASKACPKNKWPTGHSERGYYPKTERLYRVVLKSLPKPEYVTQDELITKDLQLVVDNLREYQSDITKPPCFIPGQVQIRVLNYKRLRAYTAPPPLEWDIQNILRKRGVVTQDEIEGYLMLRSKFESQRVVVPLTGTSVPAKNALIFLEVVAIFVGAWATLVLGAINRLLKNEDASTFRALPSIGVQLSALHYKNAGVIRKYIGRLVAFLSYILEFGLLYIVGVTAAFAPIVIALLLAQTGILFNTVILFIVGLFVSLSLLRRQCLIVFKLWHLCWKVQTDEE
jgi:hypothetical protein